MVSSEKMFVINYVYLQFCRSLTGKFFKVTSPISGIFFTFEIPAIEAGNGYCGNVIVHRLLPKRNLGAPVVSQFRYRVPIIPTHVNRSSDDGILCLNFVSTISQARVKPENAFYICKVEGLIRSLTVIYYPERPLEWGYNTP